MVGEAVVLAGVAYTITRRLGEAGATGDVFEGVGPGGPRDALAFKFLAPGAWAAAEREREAARVAAALTGGVGINEYVDLVNLHGCPTLVSPVAHDCLFDLVHKRWVSDAFVKLDASVVADLMRQLLSVVERLHAGGFIVGDLKPENVVVFHVDGHLVVKLIDLAGSWWPGCGRPKECIQQTPKYSSGSRSQASDVYALGCIHFFLAEGFVWGAWNEGWLRDEKKAVGEAPSAGAGVAALRLVLRSIHGARLSAADEAFASQAGGLLVRDDGVRRTAAAALALF